MTRGSATSTRSRSPRTTRNGPPLVDKTRNTETKWVPVHAFTAKAARYLRVTVTGMDDGCWLGIREVEVFDTLPLPSAEAKTSK